jgi:cbb3-type cytochrome oxidase subunit 3
MYEEGAIEWENILTILIGIAIVAGIYIILHRRRKAKHRRIKHEAELQKKNDRVVRNNHPKQNKNYPMQNKKKEGLRKTLVLKKDRVKN